jgi:hypothetical protein
VHEPQLRGSDQGRLTLLEVYASLAEEREGLRCVMLNFLFLLFVFFDL